MYRVYFLHKNILFEKKIQLSSVYSIFILKKKKNVFVLFIASQIPKRPVD